MPQQNTQPIATSARPSRVPVLIVDGYGISLTVHHGHLTIKDGIGTTRRERRLTRSQRSVRRILILARTGHISLDAIRWCSDTGINLSQVDPEVGPILHGVSRVNDDARLRRAQAAAGTSDIGLAITKFLLIEKLKGQADICEQHLHAVSTRDRIRALTVQLQDAEDLQACRSVEAVAGHAYFASWASIVECRFATLDICKVPERWRMFSKRSSPRHVGDKSPARAADPINAMLNYGYALAEIECRVALLALGLDPGLGIVHTDKPNRDSLALDVIEPIRPVVDAHILRLLDTRVFRASVFHETRQGTCRLLPPLTHEIAAHLTDYARVAAPIAEKIAHTLARSSPHTVKLRTPLTETRRLNEHIPMPTPITPLPKPLGPFPTCRDCSTPLRDRRRHVCDACCNATRRRLAKERADVAEHALRMIRQAPEELIPDDDNWTAETYMVEVFPGLQQVQLSAMMAATSLSKSACSRIRSGKQMPPRRQWETLLGLLGPGTH